MIRDHYNSTVGYIVMGLIAFLIGYIIPRVLKLHTNCRFCNTVCQLQQQAVQKGYATYSTNGVWEWK